MNEEEGIFANLVYASSYPRSGYTTYAAKGRDVAISFFNPLDQLMVFELDETSAGIREEETLMGIPDSERSWEIETDELAALIAAFSNMDAARPIFSDYFIGMRELWKLVDLFAGVCMPMQFTTAVSEDARFRDLIDHGIEVPLNERSICLMFMLAEQRGNVDRLFGRYVVIADEPITTDDLDEAVLEKIKLGGKLIEVRKAWCP